jgi:HlyD family secretion protein
MKKRTLLILSVLGAIVLIVVAWLLLQIPLVNSTTLKKGALVTTLQFTGRVATLSRVEVGSTLTGRVTRVVVREGAQVKLGDDLVLIESDELSATVQQAIANEQLALARLRGLQNTGRLSVEASLAQAQSVLKAASSELQRTETLVSKGFLSAARLDEVRRSVEVAQAQVDGANAQRKALSEQGTEVAQARAQLALAASAKSAATSRLTQSVIRAPADAQVLTRLVEPGQIVQPGRGLFTLALTGPTRLKSQVDERYLDQLRVGQSAWVIPDAFPDERFSATVLSISPLIDSQRGAVEVVLSLSGKAPEYLREDMTLSIEVETGRRDAALILPLDAIRTNPASKTHLVSIILNGRVEDRVVRLGIRSLLFAEVLEGLKEGDIVLRGAALPSGKRVRSKEALNAPPRGQTNDLLARL